jgi:large subunit ribosomal protein L22
MSTAERQRTSARRESLLGDQPGAFASARYVRITPLKARRVVDLVRGLPVQQALDTLAFAPQAAAQTVHKVLSSAVANAEGTEGLNKSDLVISVALVDEGPTMKRWRPRAQGRATRINKRTSHITLAVQPASVVHPEKVRKSEAKPAKKTAKKATAKKAATEVSSAAKKTTTKKSAPPKKAATQNGEDA